MCVKHSKGNPEPTPPFTSLFLEQPNDRGLQVASVNTVLGPVDARQLGVTLVSESLLYVLPGAQYAHDIRIDRADVFEAIAAKLTAFKAAGGGTIVDATGMFEGRDLRLYEALSRATGVHIVASTGQGPEAMLGGYFLTPQTNPPSPWPAHKFAEMFGREVNEGMVVPRDALAELQLAVDETLKPERILIGDLDRRDAVDSGWPMAVAAAGARVGIDHIGSSHSAYLDDAQRVNLILELIQAGFVDRILLSSSATGVAFGVPGNDLPFSDVLTKFVPMLQAAGVTQEQIQQMLITNTAQLLSVREGAK